MKAIFISVRSASTRLPQKALKKIREKTTIEYLIDRVKKSEYAEQIILCTTELPEDDALCELATKNNIQFFRGPSLDKLKRWFGAAQQYGIEFFVNADGDDIFFDAGLADLCFKQYLFNSQKIDFIDGRGLYNDVYGIKTTALEEVCRTKKDVDTEFVRPHFVEHAHHFNVQTIQNVPNKYKKKNIRMTLDYEEDFIFFKSVIEHFKEAGLEMSFDNILLFLEKNPDIVDINWACEEAWKSNQDKMIITKSMKNSSKYFNNELKYIKKVLNAESWSPTAGTWCQSLEEKLAEKFESRYAVVMNSGTSTLHAALEAVGVRAADEVISPALTVIMDTTATIHANAIPVYADINPHTFNIDPRDIERKITSKTKAIIVVALYGLPCDMDEIMDISRKYGIPVIEDNAQCFMSRYKGKLVGTIGDISSWSFENSKHMSCGEGGAITSNNEQYAKLARKIGGHGYKNLEAQCGQIKLNQSVYQNPHYKRHDEIGWNYRLSEFNAAVAMAQLEDLDAKVQFRKEVAQLFLDVIEDCDYLIPQHVPEDRDHSYFTLGVLYEGLKERNVSWQEFREKYTSFGGDGFYGAWSIPYLEPVMQERRFVKRCPEIYNKISYGAGLCPVAESIQPKLMQFKTNYRNMDLAVRKAQSLKHTINHFRAQKEK